MEAAVIPHVSINKPGIREHSRWDKELTEDLVFSHPDYGTITAPKGFRTDLASIRALRDAAVFLAYVALVSSFCFNGITTTISAGLAVVLISLYATLAGYADTAAALHDYLYRNAKTLCLPRWQCDRVFFLAMRATGVAKWRAYIFWFGVRTLAARYYRRVSG